MRNIKALFGNRMLPLLLYFFFSHASLVCPLYHFKPWVERTERTLTINSWRLALQVLSCLLIVKAIKSKTKRKAKFLNLRKTFVKRKVFPRALVLSPIDLLAYVIVRSHS